eukprot:12893036-Prorocentrum_lima.AAC.1
MAPADVEQQVQSFKEKWTILRPLLSVVTFDEYCKEGRLMDGVYVEICKSGKDDDSFMTCPLRTTSSIASAPRESWKGS